LAPSDKKDEIHMIEILNLVDPTHRNNAQI
jgi:hypothetical protein